MAELLKKPDIDKALKQIPEWEQCDTCIERTFEFEDFAEAIDFVNGVAEIAEDVEHHPDIDIRWNKVRLQLCTHSKGGLTNNDFELAQKIDELGDDSDID